MSSPPMSDNRDTATASSTPPAFTGLPPARYNTEEQIRSALQAIQNDFQASGGAISLDPNDRSYHFAYPTDLQLMVPAAIMVARETAQNETLPDFYLASKIVESFGPTDAFTIVLLHDRMTGRDLGPMSDQDQQRFRWMGSHVVTERHFTEDQWQQMTDQGIVDLRRNQQLDGRSRFLQSLNGYLESAAEDTVLSDMQHDQVDLLSHLLKVYALRDRMTGERRSRGDFTGLSVEEALTSLEERIRDWTQGRIQIEAMIAAGN